MRTRDPVCRAAPASAIRLGVPRGHRRVGRLTNRQSVGRPVGRRPVRRRRHVLGLVQLSEHALSSQHAGNTSASSAVKLLQLGLAKARNTTSTGNPHRIIKPARDYN